MGNASDTSAVFASTISKEHDILMGSLYSVFCKSTQQAQISAVSPSLTSCLHDKSPQVNNLSFLLFFFYRYTVPHGQLHSATCCISQAVDLEASWVLHHQSLHQWPWDDALFIPIGNTVIFFTQVSHIPLLSFYFIPLIMRNIKLISQWTINWL